MKRNSILSHVINFVNSMKTKLLHNLSHFCQGAILSLLFEVVGVIDNYNRPGDIHCTLQAPTLGHSVSSSAWVRVEASRPTMVPGPRLLCPRVSSSRSCHLLLLLLLLLPPTR